MNGCVLISDLVTCVSFVQCVLERQATDKLLHLLDITCPCFLLLVTRFAYGGHIGGSEHIHQEEGGWLGLRCNVVQVNLQALGVAQQGLGQGLQHWGGPLGWQLSSLPVHHRKCVVVYVSIP